MTAASLSVAPLFSLTRLAFEIEHPSKYVIRLALSASRRACDAREMVREGIKRDFSTNSRSLDRSPAFPNPTHCYYHFQPVFMGMEGLALVSKMFSDLSRTILPMLRL